MPTKEIEVDENGKGYNCNNKNDHHQHTPYPKLEFLAFNGKDPRA